MTITDNIHMEMANARVRVPVDLTNEGDGSSRGVEGGGLGAGTCVTQVTNVGMVVERMFK